MPVPTNVMSPSAAMVGHALKQTRTATGLTLKQVPSSPTTRLLGYGKEEEPPDIVSRQYKYLACKAYEMKLISFEKLAELLRRNYYELREEFEQGSQEGDAWISHLKRPVVLDNDVVSRLYSAGVLHRTLQVRPKSNFRVTEQVAEEAKQWRTEGQRLAKLLRELEAAVILMFVSVDESSEVEIWTYAGLLLENRLDREESASIALACHRGFDWVTDDSVAADVCKAMNPSVSILGTGVLLNMAVQNGLMTQDEVNAIQAKIRRTGNAWWGLTDKWI